MKQKNHSSCSNVPCSMFHVPKKNGFSLIELLTVMGIMTILLSVGSLALANLRSEAHIDLVAAQIRTELNRVQVRSRNGAEAGIYFEPTRFVYFEGGSYVEGALANQETILPSSLVLSAINIDSSVARFNKVTGYLEPYNDPSGVTLIEAVSGKTRTVVINRWGMISIE